MLILKKLRNFVKALIRSLVACKVCEEKDRRIADLQKQITTLSALVTPPTSASRIPLLHLEADAVLSGNQESIVIDEIEQDRLRAVNTEADRILTANY
jgi:hypothetical protein